MIIDAISNGIVIDHISAGKAMELYNILGLDKLDCSVALLKNVSSGKLGRKDIIKIDQVLDLDWDVIGYVDPGITVNIIKDGKRIMFEAQLGALRDIDFGIVPYTSSSSTIAAYAPVGAGIPFAKLDGVIGVMKAYSSCVGEGPFTCEMFGDEAHDLREAGGEYGAATGRPRRVGAFDVVASRYGIRMQGADEIALTKLDVLSYLDAIPVCTAYEVGDKITTEFPFGEDLNIAKPEFTVLKGWKCDISKCRKPEDLPKEAVDYIRFIEKATECKIKYVSVGAEREDYIVMY